MQNFDLPYTHNLYEVKEEKTMFVSKYVYIPTHVEVPRMLYPMQ